MGKCEHDWIIYPDSADEQKHRLCEQCKCWVFKEDNAGQCVPRAKDGDK